mmetsp:Transcript_39502/g.74148  ORF Transcript_39502/g.74148 Transcript_39502/m.74148 type:complete len:211 (-) Transcript_39502:118-750(-)
MSVSGRTRAVSDPTQPRKGFTCFASSKPQTLLPYWMRAGFRNSTWTRLMTANTNNQAHHQQHPSGSCTRVVSLVCCCDCCCDCTRGRRRKRGSHAQEDLDLDPRATRQDVVGVWGSGHDAPDADAEAQARAQLVRRRNAAAGEQRSEVGSSDGQADGPAWGGKRSAHREGSPGRLGYLRTSGCGWRSSPSIETNATRSPGSPMYRHPAAA